jgi:hypothetical protein
LEVTQAELGINCVPDQELGNEYKNRFSPL